MWIPWSRCVKRLQFEGGGASVVLMGLVGGGGRHSCTLDSRRQNKRAPTCGNQHLRHWIARSDVRQIAA